MESGFQLPLPLRHALESGECVLFVGAGIGCHLIGADKRTTPTAAELAQELATHFSINTKITNLAKVAQVVEDRHGRGPLEDFVRKRLSNLSPDKTLEWISSQRWRAIFTTNYDNGIERAYEINPNPPQKPVSISATSDLVAYDLRFEVPLYHIHGALSRPKPVLVLTEVDYARFRDRRRMLFELLKREFATSTFLYIGYSNEDPNWKTLLDEISEEFLPSKLPASFRIAPTTDPIDEEILRNRGVTTIPSDFATFVSASSSQLSALRVDPDRLKRIQATIPTELHAAFERSPAAVTRLLSSWEYVNQAPFHLEPNVHVFFRGDRPNWGTIGGNHYFDRDLEQDLYDDILDYVTGGSTKPKGILVLGSAGYGISTILMSVAAKLVRERVGAVYHLRTTAALLEGDVTFAVGLSKGPTCFIVDEVSENARAFQDVMGRLRDSNQPALFLCGDRLNEWRQRKVRVTISEYIVEPLSDIEIDRLLDCLANHKELNALEPLPRDLQKAVIKNKHGKELLVVLREATEGKQFDAILENEYRGIDSETCKRIYLAVCCFSQHGSYVRNALLCELIGVPFTDLYGEIRGHLDGVVIDECIDEGSGTYALRARHRTIARVVWERCGISNEKDTLLIGALAKLNLNYRPDVTAFEKFVRDDWMIDSIRGIDNKIKFFETATKKDPTSPYVRQHFARMLSREERLELALGQIDQGLDLAGKNPPRVLFHTRGMVLGKMALQLENRDIARRRLAQAEDAFRKSIVLNSRDEYGYQALSTLYLDWAKQAQNDEEMATYLSKSEAVLSEGFRNAKVKESLWVCSSAIEGWLGNQPSRIKALEQAIKDSPSSFVPRYLLGRAYRFDRQFEKATQTLEPALKEHPDEFRAFVEYALALYEQGHSLTQCIAVLRISSLHGLSDPRYIATLGGMLFLNSEFSEADSVFKESTRRELEPQELRTVYFRAKGADMKSSMVLKGNVVARRATFSLIRVEGYPTFYCHASKYGGLVLQEKMDVWFEVGFSPRGAMALVPKAKPYVS